MMDMGYLVQERERAEGKRKGDPVWRGEIVPLSRRGSRGMEIPCSWYGTIRVGRGGSLSR